jgi:2-polyprenyl-3-methyl-5-hydroxy-6-metoxy-1,4-benzoquinol methylase
MAPPDETFNTSYVGLRPDICSRVPEGAVRILDVGASDGTLGAFLLDQRPGREVYGIENDSEMAEVASKRLTGIHTGDVETLDWSAVKADGPYDCIIFADVLEHLREPLSVLRSAADALAPGGTVILSVPNIRHISAAWSIFGSGTFPQRSRGLFDRTHLRWFTTRNARELCSSAGLHVDEVGYNFRLLDRAGGKINDFVAVQLWLRSIPVIRELLAYQIVITARAR